MPVICPICKDSLEESDNVYYTECAHVFHYHCLMQWLERSKSCPQCREKITRSKIHRLHFTYSNGQAVESKSTSLEETIENLKFKILLKEKDIQYYTSKTITLDKQNDGLKREVRKVESELRKQNSIIYELQMKIESCDALEKELRQLKNRMEDLKPLEVLVNAPYADVIKMVEDTKDPKTLIKYISVLKKEFVESYNKRKKLNITIKRYQDDAAKANAKYETLEEQFAISESKNLALQKRVEELERVLGINEVSCIQEGEIRNNHDKKKSPKTATKNEENEELSSTNKRKKELSNFTIPKKRKECDKTSGHSSTGNSNVIDLT